LEGKVTNFPGDMTWAVELVPDMASKVAPFTVDTEEVDSELIEIFVSEVRRLTGELQEGLVRNNNAAVREASHSIKGMGGTMGLPEISVIGLEIENLAKEERLNDAEPLVTALAIWMATFGSE
jgi:HPt (histidine-containing phosphotransfer) domain-containing protein